MNKTLKLSLILGGVSALVSSPLIFSTKHNNLVIKQSAKNENILDNANINNNLAVHANEHSLNFGTKNYVNKDLTLSDGNNSKEYNQRLASGQFFAPHLNPRDIKNWNKDFEVDAIRNISKVPLHRKEVAKENQFISPNAGDGKVFYMDSMRANTSNSVSGTTDYSSPIQQILGTYQYVTDWIAFGGSTGEGTIYMPRAQDIDSLHRAGVKVHGTIFIAPNAFGGSPKDYKEFLGDIEKTTTNLVKIAKFYNFDGWMWNLEHNIDLSDISRWKEFMKILKTKMDAASLDNTIYYSSEGSVAAREIIPFGTDAFTTLFNDYGRSQELAPGITPNNSPLGYQVGNNSALMNYSISSVNGKSIWFFSAAHDANPFTNEYNIQTILNGPNISNTNMASSGGMAYHYKAYTPLIDHKSFSTSFNIGEGQNYFVNGQNILNHSYPNGYANLALKDLQPTWRYIWETYHNNQKQNENNSISVSQEFNSSEAWMGSSALIYNGTIASNKTLANKLFASNITLKTGDKFSFKISHGKTNNNYIPSLVVYTMENNVVKKHIINGALSDALNNYKTVEFSLDSLNKKVMTSFGVAFTNKTKNIINITNLRIGQISFIASGDLNNAPKQVISNLRSDGQWISRHGSNIRLKWDITDNIKEYLIYKRNASGYELSEITNTPSAYLNKLDNKNGKINLKIIPISNSKVIETPFYVNIIYDTLSKINPNNYHSKIRKVISNYGLETGHNIKQIVSDNKGGYYIFNDRVDVYHMFSWGGIEKIDTTINAGRDGALLSSVFVDKSSHIWVSLKGDKENKNTLHLYDKNMNLLNLIDDSVIGNIVTMKESHGYVYAVNENGKIFRFNQTGVMDHQFVNNIILSKDYTIFEGHNDKTIIINSDDNSSNILTLSPNSKISSNSEYIGKVIASRKVDNNVILVTNDHFVFTYDLLNNKLDNSKTFRLPQTNASLSNIATISENGKNIYFKDEFNGNSWTRPWEPGFARERSYLTVFQIGNNTVKNTLEHLPLKHSEENNHKWGGDFTNLKAIGNNQVLFGTSDFGRVGVINFNENEEFTNKIKLGVVRKIEWTATLNNQKVSLGNMNILNSKINENSIPKNPFDI